jgi:hypothetical protein
MIPKIRVTFPEPRDGYWDGSKKSSGDFEAQYTFPEHPGPNHTLSWSCWELNFWCICGSGRSWKEAASIAKRKLCRIIRVPATVEVIYD